MRRLSILSTTLLIVALSAHAQEHMPDSSALQTIVLLDGSTLTATITGEDSTRYTVVASSGAIHTIPKNAVAVMGPVGTTPMPVVRTVEPSPAHAADAESARISGDSARTGVPRIELKRHWDIGQWSGTNLSSVALAGLRHDSLIVTGKSGEAAIPLTNLAWMRRDNGSHFWTGAAIGGGSMLFVVAMADIGSMVHGGVRTDAYFIAPIFGAIFGSLVGSFMDDSDDFDLTALDNQQKALAAEEMIRLDRSNGTTIPASGVMATRSADTMTPTVVAIAPPVSPRARGVSDSSATLPPGSLNVLAIDIKRNWDIELVAGGRFTSVGLAALRNDSLVIIGDHGTAAIPQANLAWMRRDNGQHFWRGAAIGGGAILLLYTGLAASIGTTEPAEVLYLVPLGAGLGGLIGALFDDSDEFDLRMHDDQRKAEAVKEVFELDRR